MQIITVLRTHMCPFMDNIINNFNLKKQLMDHHPKVTYLNATSVQFSLVKNL